MIAADHSELEHLVWECRKDAHRWPVSVLLPPGGRQRLFAFLVTEEHGIETFDFKDHVLYRPSALCWLEERWAPCYSDPSQYFRWDTDRDGWAWEDCPVPWMHWEQTP